MSTTSKPINPILYAYLLQTPPEAVDFKPHYVLVFKDGTSAIIDESQYELYATANSWSSPDEPPSDEDDTTTNKEAGALQPLPQQLAETEQSEPQLDPEIVEGLDYAMEWEDSDPPQLPQQWELIQDISTPQYSLLTINQSITEAASRLNVPPPSISQFSYTQDGKRVDKQYYTQTRYIGQLYETSFLRAPKTTGDEFNKDHMKVLCNQTSNKFSMFSAFATTGIGIVDLSTPNEEYWIKMASKALNMVFDSQIPPYAQQSTHIYDAFEFRNIPNPYVTHHVFVRMFQRLLNRYINNMVDGMRRALLQTVDASMQTMSRSLRVEVLDCGALQRTAQHSTQSIPLPSQMTGAGRYLPSLPLRKYIYGDGGLLICAYANFSDGEMTVDIEMAPGTHVYGPIQSSSISGSSRDSSMEMTLAELYQGCQTTSLERGDKSKKIEFQGYANSKACLNLSDTIKISIKPGQVVFYDATVCHKQPHVTGSRQVKPNDSIRIMHFAWRITTSNTSLVALQNNDNVWQEMRVPRNLKTAFDHTMFSCLAIPSRVMLEKRAMTKLRTWMNASFPADVIAKALVQSNGTQVSLDAFNMLFPTKVTYDNSSDIHKVLYPPYDTSTDVFKPVTKLAQYNDESEFMSSMASLMARI
jgi:hypothetical protein